MGQRIKGQEVEVLLVMDNVVQDQLTAVKNFQMSYDFEILTEKYLGEKSDRFDEIFNGYSGSFGINFDSPDVFDFFNAVKDRAQRRTPGTKVNIKATLNFPSGERRRVLLQDAYFEGIPTNFGGRSEYGESTLSFKGAEPRTL